MTEVEPTPKEILGLTDEEALEVLQRHYDSVNAGFEPFDGFPSIGIIWVEVFGIYNDGSVFKRIPLTDERGREA